MGHQTSESLRRTPLYAAHVAAGARMVPFGGWEMPVQYASILAEARAVRAGAGVFDVSHMGRLWFEGGNAPAFLQRMLTADVQALPAGRSRYAFLLNEQGGVIDDTVISHVAGGRFLLVCNAGNRPAVVAWLHRWLSGFPDVTLDDATEETVMLAVQGPQAVTAAERLESFLHTEQPPSALRSFGIAQAAVQGQSTSQGWVARTGYTGEDGVELALPAERGVRLWQLLVKRGVVPCGLGARDVLRLEAGLLLHGNDIDQATTPLEAGMERFVAQGNTAFIGREALERQRATGLTRKLVGFKLLERGIPRHGYALLAQNGATAGTVTSGGHSPTLDTPIGMGYVALEFAAPGQRITVDIRGRLLPAEVVPLPFYTRKR
ncbi:MAG: glycine cleavage system aminomethyltransferase GcvT [Dehalococcoidia bacterium]|nr:glycine cleavage system aminomethyltransferase GcvT [Dehalococcoidia bacterium]